MENVERRKLILQKLKAANTAVTGRELAELCQVSRQIIVSDIAMLRAEGMSIIATSQGYLLNGRREGEQYEIELYCASAEALLRELELVVDNGGMICGSVIDYGMYGSLSCRLALSSRRDITRWMDQARDLGICPFSLLGGGAHTLIIETEHREDYDAVCRALGSAGFMKAGPGSDKEA